MSLTVRQLVIAAVAPMCNDDDLQSLYFVDAFAARCAEEELGNRIEVRRKARLAAIRRGAIRFHFQRLDRHEYWSDEDNFADEMWDVDSSEDYGWDWDSREDYSWNEDLELHEL